MPSSTWLRRFGGGDAYGAPPPQPMAPGPGGPPGIAPARGGGGLGGKLAFLTIGAGAVKAFDTFQSQKKQREHESQLSKLQTSVAVKRVESEQVAQQLQTCYQTVRSLQQALYESEQEALQRDYEEFKAPDANGDDMITRAEFNTYVRKYLASFPELSEKDFPKFDEFDLDGDGIADRDDDGDELPNEIEVGLDAVAQLAECSLDPSACDGTDDEMERPILPVHGDDEVEEAPAEAGAGGADVAKAMHKDDL